MGRIEIRGSRVEAVDLNAVGMVADPYGMGELSVKRWRRYGKDRLYVNDEDGCRVGWIDVISGEAVVEAEIQREGFEAAVAQYWRDHDHPGSGGPPLPLPAVQEREDAAPPSMRQEVEPYAITIAWSDLARNQPGQAARQQAVQHHQSAPVRTFAARVLGVHTDERAWRIGADGEEKVAARLARLPAGWSALHAVPVGDRGADIDHLVVGPAGVFTINAKHHPDAKVWVGGNTFMVNGHRQPYVRNARHEARRAAKLLTAATGLDVEVSSVIAVVGAHKGLTIKSQPEGVHVVARKQLVRWLTRLPHTLTDPNAQTILTAARRSDTWQ